MARVYRISPRRTQGTETRRISGQVRKDSRAAMWEGLQFARAFMLRNKLVPVNFGTLAGSMVPNVKDRATVVEGTLSSSIKYALVMELGRRRRRRMPPLEPIALWVLRKGIDADPEAIRRGIARKGIKAREFFKTTGIKMKTEWPKILKARTGAS